MIQFRLPKSPVVDMVQYEWPSGKPFALTKRLFPPQPASNTLSEPDATSSPLRRAEGEVMILVEKRHLLVKRVTKAPIHV